jgi:hypothetical protein
VDRVSQKTAPAKAHLAMVAIPMTDIELNRIITLKRAAELMGVHVNTVRNNYRDKFVWVSPRRCGMRVRDALKLDVGEPRLASSVESRTGDKAASPSRAGVSNSQGGREQDGGAAKLPAVRPG